MLHTGKAWNLISIHSSISKLLVHFSLRFPIVINRGKLSLSPKVDFYEIPHRLPPNPASQSHWPSTGVHDSVGLFTQEQVLWQFAPKNPGRQGSHRNGNTKDVFWDMTCTQRYTNITTLNVFKRESCSREALFSTRESCSREALFSTRESCSREALFPTRESCCSREALFSTRESCSREALFPTRESCSREALFSTRESCSREALFSTRDRYRRVVTREALFSTPIFFLFWQVDILESTVEDLSTNAKQNITEEAMTFGSSTGSSRRPTPAGHT